MKKWLTTLALSGALLLAPLSADAATFNDVPEEIEYYASVEKLAQMGVLSTGSGYFNPRNELTRGQAAKILVLAFDLPYSPVAKSAFKDVPASAEFAPYINALAEAGVINGYEDGTFKPTAKLTRGQMAKILVNVLELELDDEYEEVFTDVPEANGYALYIQELYNADITTGKGDGTYVVNEKVKRSQFALFVDRSLQYEEYGYGVLPMLSTVGFKLEMIDGTEEYREVDYTRVEAVRLSDDKAFQLRMHPEVAVYTGYLPDEELYAVNHYVDDELDFMYLVRKALDVGLTPDYLQYSEANDYHSDGQDVVTLIDPLGNGNIVDYAFIPETYELLTGDERYVQSEEIDDDVQGKYIELTITAPGEYYFKATPLRGGEVQYLYVDVIEYDGMMHFTYTETRAR